MEYRGARDSGGGGGGEAPAPPPGDKDVKGPTGLGPPAGARGGMDVVRLTFSHGTQAEHAEVIRAIRDGEAEWGRPVTIVQDLQGPKVRLGQFAGGRAGR